MNATTLFLSAVIIVAMSLGVTVFITNRHRKVNQAFLVASSCMFFWLLSNLVILHTTGDPLKARFRISLAYAISACIPTTFQFLRITIKFPEFPWRSILGKSLPYIAVNLLISASCFLPSFIKSVDFPASNSSVGLITPAYGPAYVVFNIYFLSAIAAFAYGLHSDKKTLTGTQYTEAEFLGFACISGLIVGLLFGTFFSLLIKSPAPVPIAHAASVLTLVGIVAYGISIHKILAVAVILRTITAYSLLSCYLTIVYLISWFCIFYVFKELSMEMALPAHVISALIVAFSMAPVRGRMQNVANKLIATHAMDAPKVIKKAGMIFQSVTTIDALLSHFSDLLRTSLSAEDLVVLTARNSTLVQAYPLTGIGKELDLAAPLPRLISKTREPVGRDSLARVRQTELHKATLAELEQLNMSMAIGFFSKSTLSGIVLLGPRTGNRIYDKNEQEALQILCNQFAVALENAQMYTEMQDSKIRNEILLDQLVSGVVVADPDRRISLFNHEAQRITGLSEEQAIGKEIDVLPKPLFQALETTLAEKTEVRNLDAVLGGGAGEHIRMGSAYLLGHDKKPMGALLVFTDTTELKTLEEQVRRADQLSSVGTLAAGMAHEIKNPLVTIKTFAQLLPQRYSDDDFRSEFSTLVAQEVLRIDRIVNQLLSFSKPAQPNLAPLRLHGTVDQTLKLIHEQLAQKDIELKKDFRAKNDRISGDADLLVQTLVNLGLNAIDAIEGGGSIHIETANCAYRFAKGGDAKQAINASCIRLQITDTGKGIAPDQIKKIFDPFFTSKSEGTGMGLSVAHGIIQEHHGAIEVRSELGKGSSFLIYIPLLEEENPA